MALRRLDLRGFRGTHRQLVEVLPRPLVEDNPATGQVAAIIEEVRADGDAALRRLTERFDGVALDELRVPEAEIQAALGRIPPALQDALDIAHDRILAYHAHEAGDGQSGDFESGGIVVRHLVRPMARVGCYAPGGRARYPSTVLMCAVPAQVAGVNEIVLCVPPGPTGHIDDATLAAAAVAGVHEVYRVGGAQAIAAMAYGTESIDAVDVIVGPGNRYVAEAKRQVSGVVGVASAFAGPSEVVVIAGPETPPELAAIDLVVQAEHGPDGLAWLITWSEAVADQVTAHVERIVRDSPRRTDLEATLDSGGYVVMVDGAKQACAVANVVAPEHLEILTDDAESLLPQVMSAGAVFLGPMSPASMGDYLAGPNHVLPTNRTARFASALRVDDFRRHIHAVSVDEKALEALGPHVVTLAETEGLTAHAQSVQLRWPR
ncbi:MAG TPA: histidinol dehydrogenase [Acidimicrobiales bacterium]|jgi:histidinol dehydrogenase|nr:histidinol dehydrogenase [Acidimicrobiales bacterium]